MRAVLLLAHGTPESLDEMPEYLTRVRGGRAPSPELVAEMQRNYAAIGGRSPLTERTRDQARALEDALGDGTRVAVGMRNAPPFIADALKGLAAAGATDVVAIPLAPQYSSLSVEKYREAVEAARPARVAVRFVASWHVQADLILAFAEKVRAARAEGEPDAVIFTAHSLPVRAIEAGDPYARQVGETAAAVAEEAGVAAYRLAYQSAGRTQESWLGPSLEEALAEVAAAGARDVLVAPIGFVSDHTEVLYDIDVLAAAAARALGLVLRRTESLNASPAFVRALVALVRPHHS